MTTSNGRPPPRWERLLELKPIPILDHLVEEVAKLLAQDLAKWPLPFEEFDPSTGATFAELVKPDAPRPDDQVFEEAIQLTQWEVENDLSAYDDYMHNRRWEQRGLPPTAKPALLFVSRWLLEQLSGLAEATSNRVKRADRVRILLRTRELLLARRPTQ